MLKGNVYRAQNLRQGIIMKTSFKTWVLRMGLGSFVDINILVMKYLFLHILHFFRISQIKIYKMLRPQKGYSRVLFNDTLLNFGLREIVQFPQNLTKRSTCTFEEIKNRGNFCRHYLDYE